MTGDTTFTRIAEFPYSAEAQIVKGKLESAGIETFLRDAVTIDSDPLLSHAIGGVKLFVRTDDVPRALAILAEVHLFPVEDTAAPFCPQCGDRYPIPDETPTGILRRLFSSVTRYQCPKCGKKFKA